jgi:hypothetical protein
MAVNSTRRRAPGRSGVVGALVSWSDELHRCHDCGLNRVCLHRHRIRCRGQHGRAIDRSLADRLTAITTVSGQATVFTIDALGRHASRAVGANPIESYSYLGSSNTVIGITSSAGTTTSAIDAVGNRVATAAGGAWGYLLAEPVDSESWCTHTALGVHYRCIARQGPTRAPVGTLRHGGRNAADRPLLHQL